MADGLKMAERPRKPDHDSWGRKLDTDLDKIDTALPPLRFYDTQTHEFRDVRQSDVDLMMLAVGLFGALKTAIPILWKVAHEGMRRERDFAGKCGATELLRQAAEESAKQERA